MNFQVTGFRDVIYRVAIVLTSAIGLAGGGESAIRQHWAYQPLPEKGGEVGGIDQFIDRKLAGEGVLPNPEADRYRLIRRLSLNLTGLPPTPEEIDRFVRDDRPGAYGRLVDRLLDSPHYGERWGRHWLDLARYVQGTIKVPGVDRIDLAEEYRDYVVKAFNEDKPYDQFIREQLAGDLVDGNESDYLDRVVAPVFLSIGPWFDECTDPNKLKLDIVDEQISTTTKAFLAHDFACSRCHDHKSDPIPTRDYYALAGIFRSTQIIGNFSEFWKDGRPRLTQPVAKPSDIERISEVRAEIDSLQAERWRKLQNLRREFLSRYGDDFERLRAAVKAQEQLKAWEAEDFSGHKNLLTVEGKYTPAIETRVPMERWIQYDFHVPRAGEYLLYVRYASDKPSSLTLELNREELDDQIQMLPTGGFDYEHYRWESFGPFSFRQGSNRIRLLVGRHVAFPRLDALKIVDNRVDQPGDPLKRALWRYSHSRTFWPPMAAEMDLILPESDLGEVRQIESRIAELEPATRVTETLAVTEREVMIEEAVRVGGQVYREEGEPVARAVPTLIPQLDGRYPVPPHRSGRLELADWMTDPDNPLTPRVMVNRIWHWHFGTGLVATMDNFGKLGARPVDRELLDWMAREFVDSGWSVKHVQRLIVLSRAYRRTSEERKEAEGSLLVGFPARRLEAEALYDGMAGTLSKILRQAPGEPLDTSLSRDRALYILVSGRSPRGLGLEIRKMFDLFGFDPSGRPMHDRSKAVTPDQALWFLNNPLPRYYGDRLASELLENGGADEQVIRNAFLSVLSRPPSTSEAGVSEGYLESLVESGLSRREALGRVILGLFSTREFTHLL